MRNVSLHMDIAALALSFVLASLGWSPVATIYGRRCPERVFDFICVQKILLRPDPDMKDKGANTCSHPLFHP